MVGWRCAYRAGGCRRLRRRGRKRSPPQQLPAHTAHAQLETPIAAPPPPKREKKKRKMHLDIAAFNRSEPLVTPLPMSLPPRVKFEDEDSAAAPVRPAQPVDLTGERLPPQVPPRRLCPSSRFWLVATTLLLSTFWQVMCAVAAPAVIDSIWGGVSLQVWHYIRLVLDRAGSARGGRVCR